MLGVGLILALLLTFWNAPPSEFVYDNAAIVRDHPLVVGSAPPWRAFVQTYWGDAHGGGLYRPLTILTYVAERRWLGVEAAWPHAVVNVALHGLAVLLLHQLARVWTGSRIAAPTAAALFAVHPIASEAVANLVGRADLLAVAAVFAALLCWERGLSGWGPRWLAAALLVWVAGLLSKESAVCFPAIAYVRHLWLLHEERGAGGAQSWSPRRLVEPLSRHLAVYLLLLSIGLAWFAVRQVVISGTLPLGEVGTDNPMILASPLERVMTAVYLWGLALRLVVLPIWMSADYSPWAIPLVESVADPRLMFAIAAIGLSGVLMLVLWRRRSAAFLGFAFFALAFLPVSNLVVLIGTIMAERLLYLPMAGVALSAGAGVAWACRAATALPKRQARAWKASVTVALAGALVLLAVRTHQRNAAWEDTLAFWTQATRDAPGSWRAWSNLAPELAKRARSAAGHDAAVEAAERGRAALANLPTWTHLGPIANAALIHLFRGEALVAEGRAEEAADDWTRAVDLSLAGLQVVQTDNPRSRGLRSRERFEGTRGGGTGESVTTFKRRFYANLTQAFYRLGRFDLAAEAGASADALGEMEAKPLWYYGRSLANLGRFVEAEEALSRAVEREPTEPMYAMDLELVRQRLRELNGSQARE